MHARPTPATTRLAVRAARPGTPLALDARLKPLAGRAETSDAMVPSPFDLALPAPLAAAILAASITAALFFWRAQKRRERIRARRSLRGFQRTMVRFLARRASAADLRRAAREAGEGIFWAALETASLRLARRERLRLAVALGRDAHSAAERLALRDDSPWRRVLAARRLSLVPSLESRRALRRALARGPETVAMAAAQSLARCRDRAALGWLVRHPNTLAGRSHASRMALLRAFGPHAAPILKDALEGGIDNLGFERAIIEVLGERGYRPACLLLERRLASEDLDLRVSAARALGRLRADGCATSLLAALRDHAWQVRAQAARSLGLTRASIAVPLLAARLTDPSWWVRRHAAYALLELGDDGRIALRRAAEASPDPYAREMAAEALDSRTRRGVA